jgi:hypothetical protein
MKTYLNFFGRKLNLASRERRRSGRSRSPSRTRKPRLPH